MSAGAADLTAHGQCARAEVGGVGIRVEYEDEDRKGAGAVGAGAYEGGVFEQLSG